MEKNILYDAITIQMPESPKSFIKEIAKLPKNQYNPLKNLYLDLLNIWLLIQEKNPTSYYYHENCSVIGYIYRDKEESMLDIKFIVNKYSITTGLKLIRQWFFSKNNSEIKTNKVLLDKKSD